MVDKNTKPAGKGITFERLTVNIDQLRLDTQNPRFGLKHVEEPDEAFTILVERANLKELWDSINSQGWLPLEPMVCISSPDEGFYIVIEGNRRLAAIRTLLNPSLVDERYRSRIPEIDVLIREDLQEIEIVVVKARRDADAFIGFKHVNGPASWGSLPKAKFAADMFSRIIERGEDPELALKSVTDALGDTTTSMLRMLVGYEVLEQAIAEGVIVREQVEGKSFDFSHLYTMMPNPATRNYLGWGTSPLRVTNICSNPVDQDHLEQLKHLMGWLFGTEEVVRIILAQGTDRPKLQKVLAHAAATETLVATGSLELASGKAGLDVDAWRESLIKAEAQAIVLLSGLANVQARFSQDQVDDAIDRANSSKSSYNTLLASLKSYNED